MLEDEGNGKGRRRRTDTEGGDQGGDALHAGISVSCVAGVEFVAVSNPLKTGFGEDVEGCEVKVTYMGDVLDENR